MVKSIERFCAGWRIIAVDDSKSAAKQIKSVGACIYVPAFRRVLMRLFDCGFHMSGLMLSTDPLRLRNCSNFNLRNFEGRGLDYRCGHLRKQEPDDFFAGIWQRCIELGHTVGNGVFSNRAVCWRTCACAIPPPPPLPSSIVVLSKASVSIIRSIRGCLSCRAEDRL
jgi:hypothetical protein